MPNFYNQNANQLFTQYQALTFEQVHGIWLDDLPEKPGRALDIGAGSGRDAAWLADHGWQVTAVEPSDALRKLAQDSHHLKNIGWVDDSLPGLTNLPNRQAYDLILVSAVWMHLTLDQQQQSLERLKQLQSPNGLIVITWRNVAGETERQFYQVDEALFEGAKIFRVEDVQERPGVVWKVAVLK